MSEPFTTIHHLDARTLDTIVPENSIQTTITSPPYFDMKDYGSENQIGFGQTYEQYLDDLQLVFQKVLEATKEDGTLWIIIDTFKEQDEFKLLPFDLANKLREIGWKLQDIIIWKKDKTVPWYSDGIVQRKFEYILFFSKTDTFKYYRDKVRIYDTKQLKRWWVKYPERYNPKGKALDGVWEYSIPTQGSWGSKYIKHFCPLPTDMVGNMIQLATDEEDIVLDPFSGSGSVLVQAAYMNRRYAGLELNSEYIHMFEEYLKDTLTDGENKYKKTQSSNYQQTDFEDLIIKLRCLKYARVLYQKIGKIYDVNPLEYILVQELGASQEKYKFRRARYNLITRGRNIPNELNIQIQAIINSPPLSKFGIESIVEFNSHQETPAQEQRYFGYSSTNTHSLIGEININIVPAQVKVVSNIFVDIDEKDYA